MKNHDCIRFFQVGQIEVFELDNFLPALYISHILFVNTTYM